MADPASLLLRLQQRFSAPKTRLEGRSKQAVASGFLLALSLLGATATISYLSLRNLVENRRLTSHTCDVLLAIEQTRYRVAMAQSARRGFVVTRDQMFVENYELHSHEALTLLQTLRQLTRDNSNQQRRLNQLEPILTQRFNKLRRSIDQLQQNRSTLEVQLTITREGVAVQQAVDGLLEAMAQEEHALLQARTTALDNSIWSAQWMISGGYLLSFVLLVGIYKLLRQQIYDRQQAKIALQASEERFRAAAEASLDAVYILQSDRDAAGQIQDFIFVDVNKRGAELISLSREAVIGQRLCELLPVNRTQGFFDRYVHVVEQQESLEEEFEIDADLVQASWLRHQVVPLGDGVAITSRNITAAKQAEVRLQAYADELQSLYDQAPCGYHSLNKDGIFVFINKTELAWLGYTVEEVVGKLSFSDICTDESQLIFRQHFPVFKQQGVIKDIEFTLLRKDGSTFPVILNSTAIYDANGEFLMSRSSVFDLTERKQAEQERLQSLSLLQSSMESTAEGILVTDLQKQVVFLNSRFAQLWKLPEALVNIKQDDELIDFIQAQLQDPTELLDQIERGRHDPTIEFHATVELKDGRIFERVTNPQRLKGEVVGTVICYRDITQRKQVELALKHANTELVTTNRVLQAEIADRREAERRLEQLTMELQRSNQELEQFAYIASHDLQEPLRAVAGYTELLQQNCQPCLGTTEQGYLDYIMDGSSRMQQLIRDLLNYSRVGRKGKFGPTNCDAAVQQAITNLQAVVTESHATITCAPLPTLIANPLQLTQLFQNLIGNALKFRREEAPQIRIGVMSGSKVQQEQNDAAQAPSYPRHPTDYRFTANEYLFWVCDNGIGIKPRYLDRIFEPFKRLHTRREFDGTGIGLAICKKVVEQHGGEIWAESQPGDGTTFYFTIAQPLPHDAFSSSVEVADGFSLS